MRFRRWIPVGLAGVLMHLSPVAHADEVGVEEFVSTALVRDPQVMEAWADSRWERGRTDTNEVWEDPELRLGKENRTDRDNQTSVRLRVPIPNPWEARAIRHRAGARADAESLRAGMVEWERRMFLQALYFEAAYTEKVLALRSELVQGMSADLEVAKAGVAAQALPRARYLDLMGDRSKAAIQVAEDEMEWSATRENMRTRAGWESGKLTGLTTPLPEPASMDPLPDLEQCHHYATGQRGEIGVLSAEQREDQALSSDERSASIPWFTFIEGTWVRDDDRDRDDLEARVGISLPVFSWLRGSQTEAALRLTRTGDRMQARRNSLHAAVESAWYKADAAAKRLQKVFAETEDTLRETEPVISTSGVDPRTRSGLRELRFDLLHSRLQAARDYKLAILDLVTVCGPEFAEQP